jgi:hypothetical protein
MDVDLARQAHVARVKPTRLLKEPEELGRGFSINQVQNGGAGSLTLVDLSARFVLSAPGRRPISKCTSLVLTNMTTISLIPKPRPDLSAAGN